jgi:pyruvate dehydrogenase E2 component (dihydrolipoamide acetyltransferase)
MPIELLMPALSPTMTEGNLATWVKKEGDKVSAGDVVAEIETDKATMEVEAVDEGTLGRIIVQAGSEGVKVNEVIALILEDGEDKKALDAWEPPKPAKEDTPNATDSDDSNNDAAATPATPAPVATGVVQQATKAPEAPQLPAAGAKASAGERVKASPLAKRMAEKESVDLHNVAGTGPHGRIVRADVETALKSGGGGRAAMVRRQDQELYQVPLNSMRKTIAKRLQESKQQIPHFYLTVEIEMDDLLKVRQQINAQAAARAGDGKPAYKLSVNDLVIKAVALAMRDKPECNVSWYDDAMIRYANVDISVAVATEGGLITPIVRNADQKGLPQISNEMKDLAKRARDGKLQPHEFQGGGFSISNLGMYGVKTFQAIVNPPQACILAVGASEQVVKVKAGEMVPVTVMSATLSVDHRAVDGALGAEFLQIFKRYMEQPALMLV